MQTWKLLKDNRKQIAEKAVAALEKGKVLACPTDTVYGFMAHAMSESAVRKIFRIKGRGQGKPLPIFVKDIAMAKKLARVRPLQERFLQKAWPGKITVVLLSKGVLPKETGTQQTLGLRIPKHRLVQTILQKSNLPLTGTSANVSGEPPISDSKEVLRQFQRKKYAPDILIDAGRLPFSRPSKVIDITGEKPKILRK